MIFRIFLAKRKKTYMSKVKPFILDPVDSLASHDATNCDEIKVFCSSFTLARVPT